MHRILNSIIAFLLVALLTWGYFALWKPMSREVRVHNEVTKEFNWLAQETKEWDEWLRCITNMETDYDKILREGRE